MRLKGKKCIVTGGSSGIGEATVRRFISEGAEVLIADINLEDSKKLSEEIGEGVDYIKCDVRLEDDIILFQKKLMVCGIRLMCWLTMLDLNSISPMIR